MLRQNCLMVARIVLSDLYSLAIVYQEMLTGKLPFDGKTAGELARQHLHQAPNLEPLPPADRRVVARALAKHPLDRYGSCRAFIEELRNSGTHEKYAAKVRQTEPEPESESNDNRSDNRSDSSSDSRGTSTCTSRRYWVDCKSCHHFQRLIRPKVGKRRCACLSVWEVRGARY